MTALMTDFDIDLLESFDLNPKCQFVEETVRGEDCPFNSEFISKMTCAFCDEVSTRFICVSHKDYLINNMHFKRKLRCPFCDISLVTSYSLLGLVIEAI